LKVSCFHVVMCRHPHAVFQLLQLLMLKRLVFSCTRQSRQSLFDRRHRPRQRRRLHKILGIASTSLPVTRISWRVPPSATRPLHLCPENRITSTCLEAVRLYDQEAPHCVRGLLLRNGLRFSDLFLGRRAYQQSILLPRVWLRISKRKTWALDSASQRLWDDRSSTWCCLYTPTARRLGNTLRHTPDSSARGTKERKRGGRTTKRLHTLSAAFCQHDCAGQPPASLGRRRVARCA